MIGERLALPLRLSAAFPTTFLGNVSGYFVDKKQLLKQNENLQQTLMLEEFKVKEISELEHANQILKKLLALKQTASSSLVMTRVMDVQGYPYLERLFIDHDPAIELGSAVFTLEGVVGQVIASHDAIDTVLPLVSSQSDIPVETADHSLRAIAQGDGHNGLVIQQITKSSTLKLGDVFVTSGLGGVYPAGYSVGTVVDIEPSDDQVFLTLRLKPSANLANVDYVAVLTQGKQDA